MARASIEATSILKLCFKQSLFLFSIVIALFSLSACTKSPSPQVEDLVKTRAPTFTGQTTRSFTSASQSFTLAGECDPNSKSLEYSFNGTTWTQFATSCPAGTFSTLVSLPDGLSQIRVRAKGKLSYSGTAVATVRFLLPPTSESLEFVQASSSDKSDLVGRGVQGAVGLNNDGAVISGPTKTVTTSVPGVVYGGN